MSMKLSFGADGTDPSLPPMNDVIGLFSAIERGDPAAAERLWPFVYDELRRLAGQMLAREEPGQTLQPTALVHEAYLRLVGDDPGKPWDGRRHFFAAAAEAMRRVLIDRARNRRRQKRGGESRRVRIDLDAVLVDPPDDDLLALDDALEAFAREDPRPSQHWHFDLAPCRHSARTLACCTHDLIELPNRSMHNSHSGIVAGPPVRANYRSGISHPIAGSAAVGLRCHQATGGITSVGNTQ
jgi:RNA polymerase sigma factor (TIGR02999 family)